MGLSTYATTSLEDVAAQGTGQNPYAIQLTIPKDRSIAVQMIHRAEGILYHPTLFTNHDLPDILSGWVQGNFPDGRLPDPRYQA